MEYIILNSLTRWVVTLLLDSIQFLQYYSSYLSQLGLEYLTFKKLVILDLRYSTFKLIR